MAEPEDSKAFFKPKLLGMQFGERFIERKGEREVTQLDVVGIKQLLDWIEDTLVQT